MITPYKGRFKVSQIYKGQPHKGMDLVGLDSKDIHSTVSGTVEAAHWDSTSNHSYGMGQYIRIKDDLTGHRYYFAHLSQLCVKVGQHVEIGQKIGVEGSTGHSTGSHLHYEVRRIPDNTTYLDVSQISGIPNKLGVYTSKEAEDMSKAEAIKIIQTACQFEDSTMQYLDSYRYGDALLIKLATAIKEGNNMDFELKDVEL